MPPSTPRGEVRDPLNDYKPENLQKQQDVVLVDVLLDNLEQQQPRAKSVQEVNNETTQNQNNDLDSLESLMAWETHREPSDEEQGNNERSLASAGCPEINPTNQADTKVKLAIQHALAPEIKKESPQRLTTAFNLISSNNEQILGRKSTDQIIADSKYKLLTPQPEHGKRRISKFNHKLNNLPGFPPRQNSDEVECKEKRTFSNDKIERQLFT